MADAITGEEEDRARRDLDRADERERDVHLLRRILSERGVPGLLLMEADGRTIVVHLWKSEMDKATLVPKTWKDYRLKVEQRILGWD